MCGIAGIVNFNSKALEHGDLKFMAAAMAHRGPDGEGFFINENVGLTHRRLAIIDPLDGHQPFIDEESGLVVVYNGEIYNYIEIREELKNSYNFRTNSDTEVLIKAFAKWGISCLEKFRGMFAFALYDKSNQKILLVRDRLGIKPLYYCRNFNSNFFFASELSSLKVAGLNEIDTTSIADYFRWQYVPTPKSIYKNIYKLEPGHYIELDLCNGNLKKECYWKLKLNTVDTISEEEWLERLNNELDEVIRIYVRSDVPFGAFLSGGVDSSLITALMSRRLDIPVKTFSIGFDEKEHSELPYAGKAARILGCDHYEKVVSSKAAIDILEKIVRHFGEPFADSSAVPTWYVSQMTADKVKMVLSGDGGDELFGGYWSYLETFTEDRYPFIFRKYISNIISLIAKGSNYAERLAYYKLSSLERHIKQREIFNQEELSALLNYQPDTDWPYMDILSGVDKKFDNISRYQFLDVRSYMLDDILTKVDRMSMANSLEVRVPLLDHKIVELAFQMPLSVKLSLKDGRIRTKHILKRSAERFFTPEFLDRPKMGFGIPIVEWCQVDLKDNIEERFSDKNSAIYQFVNYIAVQTILNDFYSGKSSLVAKLWVLLMFDIWMKSIND